MKEYSFGTWYPIEELDTAETVLFYIGRLDRTHPGFKLEDKLFRAECDRGFLYRPPAEFDEEFKPHFWMPMPPTPGEEGEP